MKLRDRYLFLHLVLFYSPKFMIFCWVLRETNWLGEVAMEQWWVHMACYFPLFPHHCYIPLIIAVSKNVLITVCVRRHCQPWEANIPDRVHYACDVNEVWALHISAICHQRASKQSTGCKCLLFPSTVSTNGKHRQISKIEIKITCSSQQNLIGTKGNFFHLNVHFG
jgi:hypothetical protein